MIRAGRLSGQVERLDVNYAQALRSVLCPRTDMMTRAEELSLPLQFLLSLLNLLPVFAVESLLEAVEADSPAHKPARPSPQRSPPTRAD